MARLVLIPGLGADRRMFGPLAEAGLEFEVLEHVPAQPGESLAAYAQRMAGQRNWDGIEVIGGVSLGGMLAHEIARHQQIPRTLLISSVKNAREFPFYFQLLRLFPLQRLISGTSIQRKAPRNPFPTSPEIKSELAAMRASASPEFIRWAVEATVHWRQKEYPPGYLHLHGTRDLMFPGILLGRRSKVRKGSHVMVMTHTGEIVRRVRTWLDEG